MGSSPGTQQPSLKVSVVIPVYNPGHDIDKGVERLLAQTMPPEEFEVIFVDDGSTDDTPQRLDELAAAHPHIGVMHLAHTGWPGKPRNVGIDHAAGEYIYFVDADDHLGVEALQRMYDFGKANSADVILGKKAGVGRGVPRALFQRNRPQASLQNAPLADSLTVHAMFRRPFLDEQKLRFDEEPVRLEDHLFTTHAYLHARNISVLSDYVCYYLVRRDDGGHLSSQRFRPHDYFGSVRRLVEMVAQHTEPGRERDQLYRRWLRVEVLNKLRGRVLLQASEDYRTELFDEVRDIARTHFDLPGVTGALPFVHRILARLTIAGHLPDLVSFASFEDGMEARAEPVRLDCQDNRLSATLRGELVSEGTPVRFVREGDRTLLEAPLSDAGRQALTVEELDASRFVAKGRTDLVLRAVDHRGEFTIKGTTEPELVVEDEPDARGRVVLHATIDRDLDQAAAGTPLPPGRWGLVARVSLCGWIMDVALQAAIGEAVRPGPVVLVVEPDGSARLESVTRSKRAASGSAVRPADAVSTTAPAGLRRLLRGGRRRWKRLLHRVRARG